MLTGTSGLDGNDVNLITLSKVNTFSWGGPYSLKNFQIFVKTKNSGVISDWKPVSATSSLNANFNFLSSANGSIPLNDPGASDSTFSTNATDTSSVVEWRSQYGKVINNLDYKFDPLYSGVSGLDGNDLNIIQLKNVSFYNWNGYGVKTFQVFVKKKSNGVVSDWIPVMIGGSAVASAGNTTALQNFDFDAPQEGVVAFRFSTLTSYAGDRVILYELQAGGPFAGKQTVFTSPDNNPGLKTFNPENPVANVVAVRFRTLSSFGDIRIILNEVEWVGSFTGNTTLFKAQSGTSLQSINFANPVNNVAAMMVRTVSGHGDSRIIIRELEAVGPWSGRRSLFTSNGVGNIEQVFTPAADIPNVTALRLRTISNFGGNGNTYINEFKVFGDVGLNTGPLASSGGSCSWGAPKPPTSSVFNVVEPLENQSTGHLFTKVVGVPFSVDVVALNSDRTLQTTFASTPKVVKVELVDGSGSGDCSSRQPLSPDVFQIVTFSASDLGRKLSSNFVLSKAYSDLRVRVTDTSQSPVVVSCSSDNFSVRPSSILVSSSANSDDLGMSTSSSPTIKADGVFTMTAAGSDGYSGSPKINLAKLAAHVDSYQSGNLSGSFTIADSSGSSTSNFTYSEVGYFRILSNGVYDDTFTNVDSVNGDCVPGFVDLNNKASCNFGNSTATSYFGRFVPDRLKVISGTLINRSDINTGQSETCSSSFTYAGEEFKTKFTLSAVNASNVVTKNYSGGFAKFDLTKWVNFGFSSANGVLVAGSAPIGSWGNTVDTLGTASVWAFHKINRGLPVPAYSLLVISNPSYIDGSQTIASAIPMGTHSAATEIRFGTLKMNNAYGSELMDLPISIWIQYLNSSGDSVFSINDNCTNISPSSIRFDFLSAAPNLIACQTQATGMMKAIAGTFDVVLSKPGIGRSGSLDVGINLSGVATGISCLSSTPSLATSDGNDWLGQNPKGRVTFGIYKSPIIYRRENY